MASQLLLIKLKKYKLHSYKFEFLKEMSEFISNQKKQEHNVGFRLKNSRLTTHSQMCKILHSIFNKWKNDFANLFQMASVYIIYKHSRVIGIQKLSLLYYCVLFLIKIHVVQTIAFLFLKCKIKLNYLLLTKAWKCLLIRKRWVFL